MLQQGRIQSMSVSPKDVRQECCPQYVLEMLIVQYTETHGCW